jgi:glycerol uptake facilitator-like aquaporin
MAVMHEFDLTRRLVAEWLGTAFLLAGVVGSGIMGERLAGGNDAIALLANTGATGAILMVLILVFGPVSGAHFNPAVTIALTMRGLLQWRDVAPYIAVQIVGGLCGVAIAHLMFAEPVFSLSTTARTGAPQVLAEFVATFGLVATIIGCLRTRPEAVPYAVGLFISAGYWFTSSTSFANPAVSVARAFTDTFTGIRPIDVPAFIAVEFVGGIAAALFFAWLWKGAKTARD